MAMRLSPSIWQCFRIRLRPMPERSRDRGSRLLHRMEELSKRCLRFLSMTRLFSAPSSGEQADALTIPETGVEGNRTHQSDLASKSNPHSTASAGIEHFGDSGSPVWGWNSIACRFDTAGAAYRDSIPRSSPAVESDISGGELNNQEMTYILIALATAVFILVLVVA